MFAPARHCLAIFACSAIACSAIASSVRAQPAAAHRDQLVVSPAWLASHLHDPDLVLLQVGDSADFLRAHIPGARPVTLAQISAGMTGNMDMDHGLMLEMLPIDTLRLRLAALGISNRSHVVAYFATDRISPTTRVLYTLAYAGLGSSASLLDGGMPAWQRDGHPAEAGPAKPVRAGSVTAQPQPSLVVSAEWVESHFGKPGIALLDARMLGFYDGSRADDGPRRGHIPGAQSLPFEDLYDSTGALRPAAELDARFRQAGVQKGDTVVAYCHIGQRATAVLLAAETLGYPVRLYDGSFQQWGRRADLPVENPAAK
jgi:thiosulfate/3-mercaptopyruvate sulfurtransferase